MIDPVTAVGEQVPFVFASNYINKTTIFLTFNVFQDCKRGLPQLFFFETVQWIHGPLYYVALATDKTLFISFCRKCKNNMKLHLITS